MSDRAAWFGRLSAEVECLPTGLPKGRRLTELALRTTTADGAVLALARRGAPRVVLDATDHLGIALHDADVVIGDGPISTSLTTDRPVQCRFDATAAKSWPLFTAAVRERTGSIADSMALPVTLCQGSLAAVVVLYRRTGHLEPTLDTAAAVARAITLLTVTDTNPSRDAEEIVGPSWPAIASASQATGMVMGHFQINAQDADAVIRAHAYATDTALDEVCTALVRRRLDLTQL